MYEIAFSASSFLVTNGKTFFSKVTSGNCVNNECPKDSIVIPVLSDMKKTFCIILLPKI